MSEFQRHLHGTFQILSSTFMDKRCRFLSIKVHTLDSLPNVINITFTPCFGNILIKDPTLQEKGIKENYIGQNFYRRLRCLIVLSEEVDFRFFLFVEFLPQVTTKLKKDGSVSQMQYSY